LQQFHQGGKPAIALEDEMASQFVLELNPCSGKRGKVAMMGKSDHRLLTTVMDFAHSSAAIAAKTAIGMRKGSRSDGG
jgi:hypothetical protein